MPPKKKLNQKELMELAELRRRDSLPHLYGHKWYPWAWTFFTSTNKYNFLCAANQISKSTTQIRKFVHWATEPGLWSTLWPHSKPTQFWYFYPARPVATTEFHEKWVPEILPRGPMKTDPQYGWEEEMRNKDIYAIHFNSGVSIYFKTYEQDSQNLQSGSVYLLGADEELPFDLFQELRSRLASTNGYFCMVFTATLGQDEWRRTMEPVNEQEELFKNALKLQVSMYDCLKYRDGTNSHWTLERIKEIEQECATEAEVQRRVFGRFVVSSGLKFPSFNRGLNVTPNEKIPTNWSVYSGVDIGTGGESNHPAAIIFIAVRPDYKAGVVFRGWRGDGIVTTASDILEKYNSLLSYEVPDANGTLLKRHLTPVIQSYDWQSRDFLNIATRAGLSFTPADKKRDAGANLLNTLFKLRMLSIMDNDPELAKLVVELTSLLDGTPKTKAKDDFCDALRYAAMHIPWDFEGVAGEIFKAEEVITDERSEAQKAFDERRSPAGIKEEAWETVEDELGYWQAQIDGG